MANTRFIRFSDWILGDSVRNEDERFKGRMIVIICLVAIVLLLPVTIYDSIFIFHSFGASFFAWFDYLAPWITLILIRTTGRMRLATLFFTSAIVIATTAPIYLGSTEGFSNLIWLPLFPMMASFVGDVRLGVFVTGLSIISAAFALFAQDSSMGVTEQQISVFTNLAAVLVGSLVLSVMYERYRKLWVKARASMLADLDRLAHIDELTQVANRRAFVKELESALARVKTSGEKFIVAQIDVDHFKMINDNHGHLAGDATLQTLSELFRDVLHPDDRVGRIGGEEFGILLKGSSHEKAMSVLEHLRKTVEFMPILTPDKLVIKATISIGFTEIYATDTLHELLKRTDVALYKAKTKGRNRIAA